MSSRGVEVVKKEEARQVSLTSLRDQVTGSLTDADPVKGRISRCVGSLVEG
jgi:hypothetical protein